MYGIIRIVINLCQQRIQAVEQEVRIQLILECHVFGLGIFHLQPSSLLP